MLTTLPPSDLGATLLSAMTAAIATLAALSLLCIFLWLGWLGGQGARSLYYRMTTAQALRRMRLRRAHGFQRCLDTAATPQLAALDHVWMTPLELDLSRIETLPHLPTSSAAASCATATTTRSPLQTPAAPPSSSLSSSPSSSSSLAWLDAGVTSNAAAPAPNDATQAAQATEATDETREAMRDTEERDDVPEGMAGQGHKKRPADRWPPAPRQPDAVTYRYIFASGLLARVSSLEEVEAGPLPWWAWN